MITLKVLIIAVAVGLAAGPAAAYSVPAEHPRILITKKTLPELVRRAKGPFAKEYAYAKQRADRALKSGAQFPKHFMLHMPGEPKVSGAETVKVAGHVADYAGEGLVASWASSTEGDRNVKSKGKSRIFMKTLLPAGAVITKRGGQGHVNWGHPSNAAAQKSFGSGRGRNGPLCDWRLEVAAPVGEARQYFLHVFFLTDGDAAMPPVSAALNGDTVTVKIDDAPRKYTLRLAARGGGSGEDIVYGAGRLRS